MSVRDNNFLKFSRRVSGVAKLSETDFSLSESYGKPGLSLQHNPKGPPAVFLRDLHNRKVERVGVKKSQSGGVELWDSGRLER